MVTVFDYFSLNYKNDTICIKDQQNMFTIFFYRLNLLVEKTGFLFNREGGINYFLSYMNCVKCKI